MSKIKGLIVDPTLRKAFRNKNSTNALFISITGFMGSGKTTLSKTLAYYFQEALGEKRAYLVPGNKALKVIKRLSPDWPEADKDLIIIFDDISYIIDSRSREGKEALNRLFRIRHLTKKNVIAIFNMHYSRSTAPFIRATPIRILTSLTEAEIPAYRSQYLFTVSTLWDYLYYIRHYPEKYIILTSIVGAEKIIDVTGEAKSPKGLKVL